VSYPPEIQAGAEACPARHGGRRKKKQLYLKSVYATIVLDS
jgi:hypothetical protein